jgi:dTDP-4-dehydrorhamnose reductase
MISKLIIFGYNGMLGRYIYSYFKNKHDIKVIPVSRKEFEITTENISNLENFLLSLEIDKNTCIINCNGLIPQRINNRENKDYFIINSIFPLYLSKICNTHGTYLICPTTDCVFSGKKGNYVEPDFHDETNAYGISKSLGEPINATVIRTSIIGEELENKKSFLEFVKNSTGTINGWDNHYWNGITCYQYCKIINKIITENLFWKGIRHIYSPDTKSKYEMACIIRDIYNTPININKINAETKVDKTLSSMFEINDVFTIPTLEEQIREQSEFVLF